MASGPYCQETTPSRGSQVWQRIWQLREELQLSDADLMLLFDLLPPCHWRAAALLKELEAIQYMRAMQTADLTEE